MPDSCCARFVPQQIQASAVGRSRWGSVRKLPSGKYQARYQVNRLWRTVLPTTFRTKGLADGFLAVTRTELEGGSRPRGPVLRKPQPVVLCAVALAGCAAAAWSVRLAFASKHVNAPGVQAALMVWMVLSYVFAGLAAWLCRSRRFGVLMVAAGFAMFASSLSWSNEAVPFTIGIALDFLPAVLFMHVFLAFPWAAGAAVGSRRRRRVRDRPRTAAHRDGAGRVRRRQPSRGRRPRRMRLIIYSAFSW